MLTKLRELKAGPGGLSTLDFVAAKSRRYRHVGRLLAALRCVKLSKKHIPYDQARCLHSQGEHEHDGSVVKPLHDKRYTIILKFAVICL